MLKVSYVNRLLLGNNLCIGKNIKNKKNRKYASSKRD